MSILSVTYRLKAHSCPHDAVAPILAAVYFLPSHNRYLLSSSQGRICWTQSGPSGCAWTPRHFEVAAWTREMFDNQVSLGSVELGPDQLHVFEDVCRAGDACPLRTATLVSQMVHTYTSATVTVYIIKFYIIYNCLTLLLLHTSIDSFYILVSSVIVVVVVILLFEMILLLLLCCCVYSCMVSILLHHIFIIVYQIQKKKEKLIMNDYIINIIIVISQ